MLFFIASPRPIQFFNFSILNLIELPFFSTVPSTSANLSDAALLHSASVLLLESVMFDLNNHRICTFCMYWKTGIMTWFAEEVLQVWVIQSNGFYSVIIVYR